MTFVKILILFSFIPFFTYAQFVKRVIGNDTVLVTENLLKIKNGEIDITTYPNSKYIQFYEESDVMCLEGEIKNEKKWGIWKFYRGSGELFTADNYVNDTLEGTSFTFHPNGILWTEKSYCKGKKIKIKQWNDNGILYYENSTPLSGNNYFKWYENGKLMEEVTDIYLENSKGKWDFKNVRKKYYSNGNLKEIKRYYNTQKNGLKLDGDYSCWNENGQIRFQGQYKDNKKVGKWTYWKEKGKIEKEEYYIKGELIKEIKL